MNVWRSYLFVPARELTMVRKAALSNSDSVIIDLEDAVAHTEKDKAREIMQRGLLELKDKKPIYVRINDFSTPHWEKDLRASIRYGARGIFVPKAENEKDIRLLCKKVREETAEQEGEKSEIQFQVIPLLETAKGLRFAYEIAESDPLVATLAFGSIDFSLDVGCELTPGGEELLYARSQLVIASRAAGKAHPIDSVYADFNNPDGLKYETKAVKQLGFKGKLIIHPKQIDPVNQVFAPGNKELAEAQEIVDQFEKAEQKGLASISVHNKLVDYPVYEKAKEILAFHGNRT